MGTLLFLSELPFKPAVDFGDVLIDRVNSVEYLLDDLGVQHARRPRTFLKHYQFLRHLLLKVDDPDAEPGEPRNHHYQDDGPHDLAKNRQ